MSQAVKTVRSRGQTEGKFAMMCNRGGEAKHLSWTQTEPALTRMRPSSSTQLCVPKTFRTSWFFSGSAELLEKKERKKKCLECGKIVVDFVLPLKTPFLSRRFSFFIFFFFSPLGEFHSSIHTEARLAPRLLQGSRLQQKHSDKPLVLRLASARQPAAAVTGRQINTVKRPAAQTLILHRCQ